MHIVLTAAVLLPIATAVILHYDKLAANRVDVLQGLGVGAVITGTVLTAIPTVVALADEHGKFMKENDWIFQGLFIAGMGFFTLGSISWATGTHY